MIRIIRESLNKRLEAFGYQFRKIPDKNIKAKKIKIPGDPGAISYYLKYNDYYLSLPLHKAKALTIPLNQKNYYIAAKRAQLEDEKKEFQVIMDTMDSYFKNAVPVSASEVLGLDTEEIPELDKEPAWLIYYPWSPDTISALRSAGEKRRRDKNRVSSGFADSIEELIELESIRTYKLYKSLKKNGFINDLNKVTSVRAQILINQENEYVWLINGGFHRTAISYALGFREIEVNLKNIIHRNDVEKWPAVQSAIFDKKSALKVFDNLFFSKGLELNDKWIKELDLKNK
jgi:hypothetical protein